MAGTRKTERMIVLAAEAARLRTALARTEAELRRLAEDDGDDQAGAEDPTREPLTTRIMALLDSETSALTAPEIQSRLGNVDAIESVRAILSRLAGERLIARVRHGLYCSNAIAPERGNRPEGGGP